MPLYEYVCEDCRREFEVLVRAAEDPTCPHCESRSLTKLVSVAAGHVVGGTRSLPEPPATCGRPQCGMGGCAGPG